MSLVINHNMMAMNAARNLAVTYGRLSKSTQRLSSGLRINSAADDAAGLAVREQMRSDIAVLRQGVRNANDGIAMIQTADGALSVIDEKLIRMKELAEQAATGTYTSAQRSIMDSEFQQMASEIERIAQATDFNGIHLLDGSQSATGVTIHFGTGNEQTEDYYAVGQSALDATPSTLGLYEGTSLVTISVQASAQAALEKIDNAITKKDEARAHLGAMQNRLENTITNLTIQAENLQAAESQMSDVDVATEMTEFLRNQILTQAGTAMLGQANSIPQIALTLLT
ncbi:flagellin [candidate division KSB1 bacterium]|nr:MAG: flagellin [candidate division KSB1 bacterium]